MQWLDESDESDVNKLVIYVIRLQRLFKSGTKRERQDWERFIQATHDILRHALRWLHFVRVIPQTKIVCLNITFKVFHRCMYAVVLILTTTFSEKNNSILSNANCKDRVIPFNGNCSHDETLKIVLYPSSMCNIQIWAFGGASTMWQMMSMNTVSFSSTMLLTC